MFSFKQISNVTGTLKKRSMLALVVCMAFLTTCFTGIAFFSDAAYITDGDNTQFVFSSEDDAMQILADNNYSIGEYDKVVVSNVVSNILNIKILRAVPVTVTDNTNTITLMTTEETVSDLLETLGIVLDELDVVNFKLDAKVSSDMVIEVRYAPKVTLTADGAVSELKVPSGATVLDVLSKANITLGETDVVEPALETQATTDTAVTVKRITTGEITITEEIPYSSTTVNSSAYVKGTKKVTVAGVNGSKQVTKKVTYADGVAVSEEVLSETILTQPVNEVVTIGTSRSLVSANANTIQPVASPSGINRNHVISPVPVDVALDANGIPVNYSKVITGKTSAYTSPVGAHVSCGQVANIGLVAVNPNIIPYGTRMYIVSNDGTHYGYAVAADTGGALMSGKVLIDLYMGPNNTAVCYQWGIRGATIYILD